MGQLYPQGADDIPSLSVLLSAGAGVFAAPRGSSLSAILPRSEGITGCPNDWEGLSSAEKVILTRTDDDARMVILINNGSIAPHFAIYDWRHGLMRPGRATSPIIR